MHRIFKDKYSTVIIKCSKSHGYIASTYAFGSYAGCKHLDKSEIEEYIKYVLDGFKEVEKE